MFRFPWRSRQRRKTNPPQWASPRARTRPRVELLEPRFLLSITEYPATANTPVGIAAGPDGNLYYTEQNDPTSAIGVIDSSGHRLADYRLPSPFSSPYQITLGWDGNMWFTERHAFAHTIASISTDGTGTITEYLVPGDTSRPTSITAGPDGNMWFTDPVSNTIDSIDLAGGTHAIRQFTVPQSFGITAGPDGNVWFTEASPNKIGFIDIVGGTFAITEFAIPTVNSQPFGITAGPDGNVWFTEFNSNKMDCIDIVGGTFAVTEYTIPATGSPLPNGIFGCHAILGCTADRNVWFTEESGSKLDFIDVAGGTFAITQIPTPTADSTPFSPTIGPDLNNIWFIEFLGNQVAEAINPPGVGGSGSGRAGSPGGGRSGRQQGHFSLEASLAPTTSSFAFESRVSPLGSSGSGMPTVPRETVAYRAGIDLLFSDTSARRTTLTPAGDRDFTGTPSPAAARLDPLVDAWTLGDAEPAWFKGG